ncbi:MAG: CBS domain-containing protein [Planctomycetota bacterium]|jgi:predicted transcriptional regulator
MEWNREHVAEIDEVNTTTTEKIAPTCRICGEKHWPLDPSCLGKKGKKAKAKKSTQLDIRSEQNIKQFAEKISRIKEDSAKAISDARKKLNAETEAKTKAQAQVQAELRARVEAEKKARMETEARTEAEKEYKIKLHQKSQIYEDELSKALKQAKGSAKELDYIKQQLKAEIQTREYAESRANAEIEIRTIFEAQVTEKIKSLVDKLSKVKSQAKEQVLQHAKAIEKIEKKLAAETKARDKAEIKISKKSKKEELLKKTIQTLTEKITKLEVKFANSPGLAKIEKILTKERNEKEKAQQKIRSLTESKKKIQQQANSETRAKSKAEKISEREKQARIEAEKNLQLEKKKVTSSEKNAAKTIANNQKMLTMLQQEKIDFLDKMEVEIRGRVKAEEQLKAVEKELTCLKEKNESQIEAKTGAQAEIQQLRKLEIQAQKKVGSLIQKINKMESEYAQALEEFKLESEDAIKRERQARKCAEKKISAEVKSRAKAEKKAKAEMKKRIRLQENIRHKAKSSDSKKAAIRKPDKKRIDFINIQKSKDGTGALLSIRARDIMQQNLIWANQEDSIQKVLSSMDSHSTDCIIIGNNNRAEGIVTKSDLQGRNSSYLRKLISKFQQTDKDISTQISIKWIMAKPACKLRPNSTFATIMKNMHQFGWRALPVVDLTGKVLGLVTPYSILKIRAMLKLESNPNILTLPK